MKKSRKKKKIPNSKFFKYVKRIHISGFKIISTQF